MTYSRIEQSARDAEEHPYVDHKGKAKDEGNVQEDFWAEAGF